MRSVAWSIGPVLIGLVLGSVGLASGEPNVALASADLNSEQPGLLARADVGAPLVPAVTVDIAMPLVGVSAPFGGSGQAGAGVVRPAVVGLGSRVFTDSSQPGVLSLLAMGALLCRFGARFVRVRR